MGEFHIDGAAPDRLEGNVFQFADSKSWLQDTKIPEAYEKIGNGVKPAAVRNRAANNTLGHAGCDDLCACDYGWLGSVIIPFRLPIGTWAAATAPMRQSGATNYRAV